MGGWAFDAPAADAVVGRQCQSLRGKIWIFSSQNPTVR
jgi:hypothetical protein